MIGLDTSTVVDLLNGNKGLKKIATQRRFAMSQLVLFELLQGVNPKSRRKTALINRMWDNAVQCDINTQAIKKASQIFWDSKLKGKEIPYGDCLIAASYLTNGVSQIVTANKKHFERIKDIKVISY